MSIKAISVNQRLVKNDGKWKEMIKVESMEDERLIYDIITPDTPKRIKQKLFDAIEDFEEKRSV